MASFHDFFTPNALQRPQAPEGNGMTPLPTQPRRPGTPVNNGTLLTSPQTGAPSNPTDPAAIKAFITQYQASHPAGNIQQLVDALHTAGFNVNRWDVNGTPSGNELNIGGEKFKVGTDDGRGGLSSWYVPGTDDGGGPQGGGYGIGNGAFLKPSALFQKPTLDEFTNSPGFQAGLQAFTGQMENGAASRGDLLTGGFQQDLGEKRTDYAFGKYGDFLNQAMGIYGLNYNTERNNRMDPFNMLSSTANLGLDAARGAAGVDQNTSGFTGDVNLQQGNVNAGRIIGQNNTNANLAGTVGGLGLAALQRWQDTHPSKPATPAIRPGQSASQLGDYLRNSGALQY